MYPLNGVEFEVFTFWPIAKLLIAGLIVSAVELSGVAFVDKFTLDESSHNDAILTELSVDVAVIVPSVLLHAISGPDPDRIMFAYLYPIDVLSFPSNQLTSPAMGVVPLMRGAQG
jgi:hypothetical protein